jgi:hypothetical protein
MNPPFDARRIDLSPLQEQSSVEHALVNVGGNCMSMGAAQAKRILCVLALFTGVNSAGSQQNGSSSGPASMMSGSSISNGAMPRDLRQAPKRSRSSPTSAWPSHHRADAARRAPQPRTGRQLRVLRRTVPLHDRRRHLRERARRSSRTGAAHPRQAGRGATAPEVPRAPGCRPRTDTRYRPRLDRLATPGEVWPEPWTGDANAHMKDAVETYLNREVCRGTMSSRLPSKAASLVLRSPDASGAPTSCGPAQ